VKRIGDINDLPVSFDVPSAGREFFGLSERSSYAAAHRYLETDGEEGLPCVRIGGRLVAPTGEILRMLGFDAASKHVEMPSLVDKQPKEVMPMGA
jgi:hypothetical protein